MYHSSLTFNGPCREKTCLGFWLGHAQTCLLSYRDFSESCKIACCKLSFRTFLRMNNKGADQTALMRRLICAYVVRILQSQVFSRSRPKHSMSTEVKLYSEDYKDYKMSRFKSCLAVYKIFYIISIKSEQTI